MFFIYILYTFLSLDCAPLALYSINIPTTRMRTTSILLYKTRPCVHALYLISQPSGMEVRPHSPTERTGPYMTGTVIDSGIGHQRSRDIGPDTDRESNLQRLINKRAQQLKDDRQSLKDRLERYVQLRVTQHCTPTHLSYNLFDERLKSFDTWTHKEGVPSPEPLAEAGFFFRGT